MKSYQKPLLRFDRHAKFQLNKSATLLLALAPDDEITVAIRPHEVLLFKSGNTMGFALAATPNEGRSFSGPTLRRELVLYFDKQHRLDVDQTVCRLEISAAGRDTTDGQPIYTLQPFHR